MKFTDGNAINIVFCADKYKANFKKMFEALLQWNSKFLKELTTLCNDINGTWVLDD